MRHQVILVACCIAEVIATTIPKHTSISAGLSQVPTQHNPILSAWAPSPLQRRSPAGPRNPGRSSSSASLSSAQSGCRSSGCQSTDRLNKNRELDRSKSLPNRESQGVKDFNRSKSVPLRRTQLFDGTLSRLPNIGTLQSHQISLSRQSSLKSDTSQGSRPSWTTSTSSRPISRSSSSSWSRSPSPNSRTGSRPPVAAAAAVIGPSIATVATPRTRPETAIIPPGYGIDLFDTARDRARVSGMARGGSVATAVGGQRVRAKMETGPYGYGVINTAEPGRERTIHVGPNSSTRYERGTIPSDRGQARIEAEVYYDGIVEAKAKNWNH